MSNFLFTSESVAIGHPDKIADQISDAILDECLKHDVNSRVACETLVATGLVVLAGEITTSAEIDYQAIARDTIRSIGYNDGAMGFDYRSCAVLTTIHKQSSDISRGVNAHENGFKEQGAGDQGIMFGYASDETEELMPLAIMLAHQIVFELKTLRENNTLNYLRPDGKAQVTVEYDSLHRPIRIHTIVISTQHSEETSLETITQDMKKLAQRLFPQLIDKDTLFYINPTGRFVIGGPHCDCGLTGRKTIVDTYGGYGRHGGGAFSGKDPSKVDRSASYAARYVAKNIVAAGFAKRCEIQLSYGIGIPYPLAIKVETFGTWVVSEEIIGSLIPKVFNLTPNGIIKMLDLKRPIYRKTAFGGHFGRKGPEFSWEQTDKVKLLQAECREYC